MPRVETITRTLYQFAELSEDARQRVLERLWSINIDHDWYESVYDDALHIGLTIKAFDLDRGSYAKGAWTQEAEDSALLILADHGPDCDTVETAYRYLHARMLILSAPESWETFHNDELVLTEVAADKLDTLSDEYRYAIQEDYLSTLRQEYAYLTSHEAIIESIEANEYEFLEDGSHA